MSILVITALGLLFIIGALLVGYGFHALAQFFREWRL